VITVVPALDAGFVHGDDELPATARAFCLGKEDDASSTIVNVLPLAVRAFD
jgi:hypothetical protein